MAIYIGEVTSLNDFGLEIYIQKCIFTRVLILIMVPQLLKLMEWSAI